MRRPHALDPGNRTGCTKSCQPCNADDGTWLPTVVVMERDGTESLFEDMLRKERGRLNGHRGSIDKERVYCMDRAEIDK